MVQIDQLLLVCIAGYCLNFSFKYLPDQSPIVLMCRMNVDVDELGHWNVDKAGIGPQLST